MISGTILISKQTNVIGSIFYLQELLQVTTFALSHSSCAFLHHTVYMWCFVFVRHPYLRGLLPD